MAHVPEIHDVQAEPAETRSLRQIERERAMLAEGLAEFERGEYYDWTEVKNWMAALETDPSARLPPPPKRP